MCQYNNIILPDNINLDEVYKVFKMHNFRPMQVYNNSLSKQLVDKLFLMSPKNQCDCGSVISSARHRIIPDLKSEKEIEKIKRKGWSDTKIKNYLTSKLKADTHKTNELETERINWYDLIKGIFDLTKINSFGILAHEYSGDISTVLINVESKRKIKMMEFSPQQLDSFQLDEYNEIHV